MRERTAIQFVMLIGEGVASVASGAVVFILIARIAGPELLGQYTLLLAWVLTFQALGSLGIGEFVMREIGALGAHSARYLAHGLMLGGVSSLIAMALMAATVHFVAYAPTVKGPLLLGALALPPGIVAGVCKGAFIAKRKSEWVCMIGSCEALTVALANVYLLLAGFGIKGLALSLIGGRILTSLLSLWLVNRKAVQLEWGFDWRFCRSLIPPIFTFALSGVLGMVSMRLNIIILSALSTVSVVGLYAVANKVMEIVLIMPNIFAQLLLPQFAAKFARAGGLEHADVERTLRLPFSLTVPLGLGILFFAGPLVEVVFGHEFAGSTVMLRILMVFFLIESVDAMMGVLLKAVQRQGQDVLLFASNPVAMTVASVWLIPYLGGAGAAVARLVGVLCSSALRYIVISRAVVRVRWARVVMRPLVACGLLIAVMIPLSGYVPVVALGIIYVALAGSLLLGSAWAYG